MAWSNYQLIIAAVMVVTGSINTLSTKWADLSKAMGTERIHLFNHPFLQAVGMFIGEFSCLIAYYISRWYKRKYVTTHEDPPKFNPLIFLPPAMMDMCATMMLYIALNMTFASSFQMLRGAVIIFTAFLSVTFLQRTVKPSMWVGIVVIIGGLAFVGVSDIVFGKLDIKDRNGIIAGDLLIIIAQVVLATQMVYEERFVYKYNVPALKAVGLEGLFGMIVMGLLLIPFYYIEGGTFFHTNPKTRVEDVVDAFTQMGNNRVIIIASVGNVVSIAIFNFSGITVTKEISATTRMVLDTMRTIVIWIVSLIVHWQHFQYMQLIGFLFILFGMCLYYNIIVLPFIYKCIRKLDSTPDQSISPSQKYVYKAGEDTETLLATDMDSDQHMGVDSMNEDQQNESSGCKLWPSGTCQQSPETEKQT